MKKDKDGVPTCNDLATHRVCWPGADPLPACEKHKNEALRVGNAIGCDIPIIEPLEGQRCIYEIDEE